MTKRKMRTEIVTMFCEICNKNVDNYSKHTTLKTHLNLEALKLSNPIEFEARKQRENNKIECNLCFIKLVPNSLNDHKRSIKHQNAENIIWKEMLSSCNSYNLKNNNHRLRLGLKLRAKVNTKISLPLDALETIRSFLTYEDIASTLFVNIRFPLFETFIKSHPQQFMKGFESQILQHTPLFQCIKSYWLQNLITGWGKSYCPWNRQEFNFWKINDQNELGFAFFECYPQEFPRHLFQSIYDTRAMKFNGYEQHPAQPDEDQQQHYINLHHINKALIRFKQYVDHNSLLESKLKDKEYKKLKHSREAEIKKQQEEELLKKEQEELQKQMELKRIQQEKQEQEEQKQLQYHQQHQQHRQNQLQQKSSTSSPSPPTSLPPQISSLTTELQPSNETQQEIKEKDELEDIFETPLYETNNLKDDTDNDNTNHKITIFAYNIQPEIDLDVETNSLKTMPETKNQEITNLNMEISPEISPPEIKMEEKEETIPQVIPQVIQSSLQTSSETISQMVTIENTITEIISKKIQPKEEHVVEGSLIEGSLIQQKPKEEHVMEETLMKEEKPMEEEKQTCYFESKWFKQIQKPTLTKHAFYDLLTISFTSKPILKFDGLPVFKITSDAMEMYKYVIQYLEEKQNNIQPTEYVYVSCEVVLQDGTIHPSIPSKSSSTSSSSSSDVQNRFMPLSFLTQLLKSPCMYWNSQKEKECAEFIFKFIFIESDDKMNVFKNTSLYKTLIIQSEIEIPHLEVSCCLYCYEQTDLSNNNTKLHEYLQYFNKEEEWSTMWLNKHLTIEFINRYEDKICWAQLLVNPSLPMSILIPNIPKLLQKVKESDNEDADFLIRSIFACRCYVEYKIKKAIDESLYRFLGK